MTPQPESLQAVVAETLLPCPFCGGDADNTVIEGSTFRWRKVVGCCTSGPEVRHNTLADDQAAAEIESKAAARAAWNRRIEAASQSGRGEVVAEVHVREDSVDLVWVSGSHKRAFNGPDRRTPPLRRPARCGWGWVMPYSDEMPSSNSPCEIAMIRDLARLLLERMAAANKDRP